MTSSPHEQGERRLIERIRKVLPDAPPGETWIGDDAAVIERPRGHLLLATDAVVAGVHADLEVVGLDDMGWRAISSNVSDIAAMGGRPWRAVVSLAVPRHTSVELLYSGLAAAAARYECPLVGGDLVSSETLVVSVALTGTTDGEDPLLRSGARPGDALFVTGPLGSSAAGLRLLRQGRAHRDDGEVSGLSESYRRPVARTEEGLVARRAGARAMIDISDGLAIDLLHLAEESGVGLVVDKVPVAEGATLDEALTGGDDYELLFSAPDSPEVSMAFGRAGLREPIRIGSCTADPASRLVEGSPLEPGGWEHSF